MPWPMKQGGELFTLLKKKVRFSDSEARFYVANVALFLEAAHGRGVVYRDMKPENLLIDEQDPNEQEFIRGFFERTEGRLTRFFQDR